MTTKDSTQDPKEPFASQNGQDSFGWTKDLTPLKPDWCVPGVCVDGKEDGISIMPEIPPRQSGCRGSFEQRNSTLFYPLPLYGCYIPHPDLQLEIFSVAGPL